MPTTRTRWLAPLLLGLLALDASADFTEFEDRPDLMPGGSEETSLASPEPVPLDGTSFLTAFPDGVKLIRGSLDADDVDVYEVVLGDTQLLLASLFDAESGAQLDAVLGVFSGATLPTLAVDDDDGRGFHPRLGYTAASGTFQVGVSGFGDAAFDGSHGEAAGAIAEYDLVLAVASDPPLLQEGDLDPGPQGLNDGLLAADLLPANGAAVRGSLLPNDVDYFAIEVEEEDRLFVSVYDLRQGSLAFAGGEVNDPVLTLFDATDTRVDAATDDDAGGQGFVPGRAFTVPPGQTGRWSIAVSGFGDSAFDGSHDEGPFDYVLVVARERACPFVTPLISGLMASTAEPYAIAELEGGDHYYTDRNNQQRHVLVDVPEDLECGQWIQTANEDKTVSAFPHLTFTLAQDASVYIGYDTRATGEPAWLASGFTPLPELIDIRDPDVTQEFDVLRRDFPAGTVQLGGNQAPGAGSNYVVIALPLDLDDPGEAFEVPDSLLPGQLVATISGVEVTIEVSSGQTPAQVAAALAAAVNANPTLQAARVFGLGSGDFFVTTGALESWELVSNVPSGPSWPVALALLALGILESLRHRSRRTS